MKRYDEEGPDSASWALHRKHIFVLSSAGKPIFSRFGDESLLAPLAGVLQALISFVSESGDTIRYAADLERVHEGRRACGLTAAREDAARLGARDDHLVDRGHRRVPRGLGCGGVQSLQIVVNGTPDDPPFSSAFVCAVCNQIAAFNHLIDAVLAD